MLDHHNDPPAAVIACNPKAIDSENRDDHEALANDIFSSTSVLEVKELSNGYGFRLPLETPMLHKVATFVANERLCCPFFTFTLVVGEQFWLELSGTQAVKDYIKSVIVTALEANNFQSFERLEAAYTAVTGSTKE